jgi:hypothetical protein
MRIRSQTGTIFAFPSIPAAKELFDELARLNPNARPSRALRQWGPDCFLKTELGNALTERICPALQPNRQRTWPGRS